jgi:hypothetical protein
MGYTHYWTRKNVEISDELWESFADDCRKIVEKHAEILCYESDEPEETPLISPDHIRFNGKRSSGHETFFFERHFIPRRPGSFKSELFGFCKTGHKPYDEAVVDVLSCAKHRFGDIIDISSDGGAAVFKSFDELSEKYGMVDNNLQTTNA